MITVGSLFAGIGGIGKGLEDTGGFHVKWQVEIDDDANKVLEKHWPAVTRWGDVRTFPPKTWVPCLDTFVSTWYNPRNPWEVAMAGKLKKLTPEQAEECVKMYQAGLSLAPIAEYFRVSRQAMWDLVRRRTEMRSQKRFGKDNHFYRGGNRADDQAQNLLETAVERGVIERVITCEECGAVGKMKDGRNKVQAHHGDYNKPLEVTWLCQKCHHTWHKQNTPTGKEQMVEADPHVDLICGGFP